MHRSAFTKFTLNKILKQDPPPRGPNGQVRQRAYWDGFLGGFGLRVSSTGRASWILVGRA